MCIVHNPSLFIVIEEDRGNCFRHVVNRFPSPASPYLHPTSSAGLWLRGRTAVLLLPLTVPKVFLPPLWCHCLQLHQCAWITLCQTARLAHCQPTWRRWRWWSMSPSVYHDESFASSNDDNLNNMIINWLYQIWCIPTLVFNKSNLTNSLIKSSPWGTEDASWVG